MDEAYRSIIALRERFEAEDKKEQEDQEDSKASLEKASDEAADEMLKNFEAK